MLLCYYCFTGSVNVIFPKCKLNLARNTQWKRYNVVTDFYIYKVRFGYQVSHILSIVSHILIFSAYSNNLWHFVPS